MIGRARVPARRGPVYGFGCSLTCDRVYRGLREQRIAGTRSLPAMGARSLGGRERLTRALDRSDESSRF
jgi:hypothetical protein